MSRAGDVGTAAEELVEAGATLASRPPQDVLAALCEVVDGWRAPDSPWQRLLCGELAKTTGFSEPTIAAGLRLALADWSGDALRASVARELGDAFAAGQVRGFPVTAQILGGSIPMPSMLSLLLPLVLRSPVLVKPGRRDPSTARVFVDSIRAVDAELADCVAIVSFDAADEEATIALARAAACVVATGSDESLATIARHLTPGQRFVGYGHKLSLGLVGPETASGRALADAAEGLALDTALWDQQGCLSAAAVFVDGDAAAADRIAEALAGALGRLEHTHPRGRVDAAVASSIAHERDTAQMRAAGGADIRVHSGDSYTVVREADAAWRPTPLGRFIRVFPAEGCWRGAIEPLARYLSSAAIAGFGERFPEAVQALGQLGACRICAPGRLQAPALGWHHDGRPILTPLARFSDVESGVS